MWTMLEVCPLAHTAHDPLPLPCPSTIHNAPHPTICGPVNAHPPPPAPH